MSVVLSMRCHLYILVVNFEKSKTDVDALVFDFLYNCELVGMT